MTTHVRSFLFVLFLMLGTTSLYAQSDASQPVVLEPDAKGWFKLFDGETLSGWTAPNPGQWRIEDGVLVGTGPVSHLFSPNQYRNLEFKSEVYLSHEEGSRPGNSGMYFRADYGTGWPVGYEAQVENIGGDRQKTGSLYNFAPVHETLVQEDTWWTQHIIAIGNRIIIKVNDQIVVDYVDEENTHEVGHLAFQQHHNGSIVKYRNAQVRPLPADEAAAFAIIRADYPNISAR